MSPDRLVLEFDRALRTLVGQSRSVRPHPDAGFAEGALDAAEKRHAAGLMRVNHSGEVCAQALYQGQALMARDAGIADRLRQAAQEEVEHLAWTAGRLRALGETQSLLNPLWYFGALGVGIGAAALGDRWSLGFLAETERQVEAHLASHLEALPEQDMASRAVVAQMKDDEAAHAETACALGAAELPAWARTAMKMSARVMTTLAYRI